MARVVGIDPGTVSFDLFGWEEGEVFLDASIPSRQVAEDPEGILALLEEGGPLDYIAGPSGYGLPLVSVREVGEREMFLMTLVEAEEREGNPRPGGDGEDDQLGPGAGAAPLFYPGRHPHAHRSTLAQGKPHRYGDHRQAQLCHPGHLRPGPPV